MRIIAFVTALVITAGAFSGCSGKADDDGRPLVFASFYAVGELVKLVGGDKINLRLIVDGGEPHEWEPAPKDLTRIQKAAAVFYNGFGIEGFIGKLRNAAPKAPFTQIFDENDEDFAFLIEFYSGDDPHKWLNPRLTAYALDVILAALVAADPDNADYYAANHQTAREAVGRVATKYLTSLVDFPGRYVVITHAAFGGLFGGDFAGYNIVKQYALTSAFDDEEPTPAKVAECIDFIKDNGVKVIFYEEGGESKVADAIAKEAGIKTATLNTMEYDTGAGGYADIMTANLQAILASFEGD